jgi:hypothetical protein
MKVPPPETKEELPDQESVEVLIWEEQKCGEGEG